MAGVPAPRTSVWLYIAGCPVSASLVGLSRSPARDAGSVLTDGQGCCTSGCVPSCEFLSSSAHTGVQLCVELYLLFGVQVVINAWTTLSASNARKSFCIAVQAQHMTKLQDSTVIGGDEIACKSRSRWAEQLQTRCTTHACHGSIALQSMPSTASAHVAVYNGA